MLHNKNNISQWFFVYGSANLSRQVVSHIIAEYMQQLSNNGIYLVSGVSMEPCEDTSKDALRWEQVGIIFHDNKQIFQS